VLANLAVVAVAGCFVALYRFAAALFILFVGVALGMAVKPGVERLRGRGIPRWAGALAITLAFGAAAAGVLVLAVPVVAEEAEALVSRGPRQVQRVHDALASSSSTTLRRLAQYLPARLTERTAGGGGAEAALPVGVLLAYARSAGRNALTVAGVLLLGYYWTLEGDRRIRELLLLVPVERRRAVRAFVAEVERTVGAYLRGQSLVCAVVGLLAFGLYEMIGLPHAPTLGLVYAVGEAVPVLGPLVGTAVAALVALPLGPAPILWVLGVAAFLQLIENYVLIPRVMDRTLGMNPFVTLLALSAFGSVLGVAGAVLATPLAAIVQLLFDRLLLGPRATAASPAAGRDRVSAVRYEVQELALDLRKRARGQGRARGAERLEDAVEGIAADLDRVLAGAAGKARARP
jgi:predicted PurR-regulated permease PerM